jgi:pentatricopeptide repeat protein
MTGAMRAASHAALLALALAAAGCSSCNDGPPVPFGLDAGTGAPDDPGAAAPPAPSERPVGRSFAEGTRRVDVEGGALEVDGSIRALWAQDVDDDGDRDAVLLASGPPEAPVRLLHALRDGSAFAPLRELGHAPAAPEGCAIAEASLTPLGERWLVARATLGCEEQPSAARRELWVLDVESTPRALEHLAVLAPEGRAPGTVRLELSAEDRDEDAREDLVVAVSVARGGEPARIELPWLDRPSGLARDADEPESTLNARSRQALRHLLRRRVERGLEGSRAVLALHEVLCREPGRARLRVGETGGLSCGTSEGAGRAATTVVRALARQGNLLEALEALERMETPGLLIDDERREYARRAIAEAPATAGIALREGPEHRPPAWESSRVSALGFLDEDHVILRGPRPRVWNVATGEVEPLDPSQSELRLLDPSKRYAVAGVERRCAGHVLRIVPAASLVSGNVFGGTHATPLLEARDPPPGAPCPDLTPALRDDDGGWRVLGWAPQGVVAARGAELRVVPLDVSAQPAGEPEPLAGGTPPPAPLPPGPASSDGRFHAEVRGLGVVLHRTVPEPESTVLWPEGWAEREGAPSDPAASPSGRRVAVLRGGRVLLLERTGAD